ncbi:hypothetical protein PAPYR_8956 [Paratrimastix pyriformis]|uniref:Uncharacterized protein n=1 Tax=Paratrimastix pyriformis TaxID=342808 RepID=A0ABQ8UC39_9EUKA|nr:hypothetical protein PAPYR_8956 [Paratrimastix pyriformis]
MNSRTNDTYMSGRNGSKVHIPVYTLGDSLFWFPFRGDRVQENLKKGTFPSEMEPEDPSTPDGLPLGQLPREMLLVLIDAAPFPLQAYCQLIGLTHGIRTAIPGAHLGLCLSRTPYPSTTPATASGGSAVRTYTAWRPACLPMPWRLLWAHARTWSD